jgi:hypothetical protein
MLNLLLIHLSLFLFQGNPVPSNPVKALDVCTVLKDSEQYRGKIISIRGRWDGPDILGDCATPGRAEKNRFGAEYSDDRIFLTRVADDGWDEEPNWTEDPAVQPAFDKYLRLWSQGHNIIATFVGRLETSLTEVGAGYGHNGVYRAQMVLVTIKNVVSETGKPVREPATVTPIEK